MGGCCCCSSKATELNSTYYPRASEERVPLSSHHGVASALSTALLVDTNLETSFPDTYRPPPTPMPYDVALGRPQTPPVAQEICANKSEPALQTTTSDSVQETCDGNTCDSETSVKCEDMKEPECKAETNIELASLKEGEVELSKTAEEDACPICLEEYDVENPKIITKCDHHFHLACILEWMERSDTCPMCDQEMIFNTDID